MISLDQVTKVYGSQRVLQVDRFELNFGDRVFVWGGNGSGKSTLLRVLAGITVVSSGRVERARQMRGMHVIYVPQHGGFNPDRSVAEHLAAVSRLYRGRGPGGGGGRNLAGKLGIEALHAIRMGRLSGGFQRLVMLIGALSVEADAVFLDEPFNGLDPEYRTAVSSCMTALSESAALLVMTGHSGDEAPVFARRVQIVEGRVDTPA